jgi:hypothetical protein
MHIRIVFFGRRSVNLRVLKCEVQFIIHKGFEPCIVIVGILLSSPEVNLAFCLFAC